MVEKIMNLMVDSDFGDDDYFDNFDMDGDDLGELSADCDLFLEQLHGARLTVDELVQDINAGIIQPNSYGTLQGQVDDALSMLDNVDKLVEHTRKKLEWFAKILSKS